MAKVNKSDLKRLLRYAEVQQYGGDLEHMRADFRQMYGMSYRTFDSILNGGRISESTAYRAGRVICNHILNCSGSIEDFERICYESGVSQKSTLNLEGTYFASR